MPSSRRLIASNTLTGTAASVTFSSIPGTYTDLVIKLSARGGGTGTSGAGLRLTFNGTTTNYSTTALRGDGAAAWSGRNSSSFALPNYDGINDGGQTSNTFSNTELYIPAYTASQNKPVGSATVIENNSAVQGDSYIYSWASLWSNTAAITSIKIETNATNGFVSGSSFFLYGISNS